jgi:hypothetical protein
MPAGLFAGKRECDRATGVGWRETLYPMGGPMLAKSPSAEKDMKMSPKIAAVMACLLVGLSTGAASAQEAQRVPVRGTIEAVADDGATLNVRTREGEAATVHLKPETPVTLVAPASLADVKPGLFIGAAAMPGPEGSQKALEVHIFPESMRGTGEGFRPFGSAPGGSMTNGSIEARVDGVDGPKLTVAYKGGRQTILVDQTTPVVLFTKGALGDLKMGAAIVARGTKAADGAYDATFVLVGKDGFTPPL